MAWRGPGDKLLSETMMFGLLTHICVVTRPRWISYIKTGAISSFLTNIKQLKRYGLPSIMLEHGEWSHFERKVCCFMLIWNHQPWSAFNSIIDRTFLRWAWVQLIHYFIHGTMTKQISSEDIMLMGKLFHCAGIFIKKDLSESCH